MHMLDCLSLPVPGHSCLSQCKKDLQQIQQLVDFDHLFVVFFHQSGWLHSMRPQESWKEIFDLEKPTKLIFTGAQQDQGRGKHVAGFPFAV